MIPVEIMVPLAVVALALLARVLLQLCRFTGRGEDPAAARLASKWVALWMVGLVLVTFGGRPRDESGGPFFNWIPFATQTAVHQSEIVLNLLLFTPAGFLLPWIARHAVPERVAMIALCAAALLSSAIEVVQTFTPLGTAGDITDILLNTGGCIIAATVSSSVRQRLLRWRLTPTATAASG